MLDQFVSVPGHCISFYFMDVVIWANYHIHRLIN